MIATVSPSVDVPRRLDHARKMIFINYKLIMHDANASVRRMGVELRVEPLSALTG